MVTVSTVVQRAIKRSGVVPLGQAPSNAEVSDGVDAFNDMVFSWENKNIDIGHTTKGLNDTFPFADKHILGVTALLAINLAGTNGVDVGADVVRDAQKGWQALLSEYNEAPEDVEIDRGLTTTPSQNGFMSDFINDT